MSNLVRCSPALAMYLLQWKLKAQIRMSDVNACSLVWMFSITEVTFKAETIKQQQHRIWKNNSQTCKSEGEPDRA